VNSIPPLCIEGGYYETVYREEVNRVRRDYRKLALKQLSKARVYADNGDKINALICIGAAKLAQRRYISGEAQKQKGPKQKEILAGCFQLQD